MLRENVYVVYGGAANAGFVIGSDAVIVIDPQRTPPEAEAQIAEIAKVTDKPIRTLVITHSDPDHVGGLPAYDREVEVIAHENTVATINIAAKDGGGGTFFGPLYRRLAVGDFIDRTISDSECLVVGEVPIQIRFIAPAHSSGDLVAYFPDQRIVFAGDIVLTNYGPFPIIHIGGSSQGWIEAMEAILALDADTIVPGHGPIVSRRELEARLKAAEERRAAIKTMIADGKTLEQIDEALPPEIGNPLFPSYNQSVFDELTRGYPEAIPPWDNVVGWEEPAQAE